MKRITSSSVAVLLLGFLVIAPLKAKAEQVPLTILHTNDVHSHYRPDRGPFGLGGIARVATTIRRERAKAVNSLLLDGGDWSEGNIYYNLEAGRTSLEVMNQLGYDAVVIGNHDWLNGPDQLMRLFAQVPPKFSILAANIDTTKYGRAAEFSKYVQPYQILRAGPLKVAVIGLVTYEMIYDKYFQPVTIKDPFSITRKLAAKLKKEADLVVVISHNGMSTNKLIAGLPNVDIVIHAHDHVKLPTPVVVEKNGKTAIMVEAHHWGFYVGKLQLVVDTETKKYTVKHYELLQQDSTVPEDEALASLVNNYDKQLEQKYGDIFHDHLADSQIDLRRDSTESLYGNLLTDAYREATGADVSFEQVALTSNEIHRGPQSTVDIYNALTAIWNPITNKAWTLTTMKMTGETLNWVMNLILSLSSYIPGGLVSVSGIHAVYDPLTLAKINQQGTTGDEKKVLKSLEIGGAPVEPKKQYLVAIPHGIVEAIDFIEDALGNKIERTEQRDTGLEDWRVLASYLQKHSPITSATVGRGGRITVLQSDLALYQDEIQLARVGTKIQASVKVRNLGTAASSPRSLMLTYDKTPTYVVDDPNPAETGATVTVPAVAPGKSVTVKLALDLPAEMKNVRVPLYFMLDDSKEDPNKSNDGTWMMAELDGKAKVAAPKLASIRGGRAHHDED